MSVALTQVSDTPLNGELFALLHAATNKIAPNWPLDQMIAVNPCWQMRSGSIESVSARLSALSRSNLLMSKDHYLARFEAGEISPKALELVCQQRGQTFDLEALLKELKEAKSAPHWHNISDLLDSQRDPHKMAWRDEIIHQISQFCAAHYQQLRPILHRVDAEHRLDLYRHWLDVTRRDRGISIIMDEPGLHEYFHDLPDTAEGLLSLAVEGLEIEQSLIEPYAHSLLLDVNGWASWVAYQRWQGDLHQQPDDEMLQFLAIRMAWEWVIWQYLQAHESALFEQLNTRWKLEQKRLVGLFEEHKQAQDVLWLWASADELSYQLRLNGQLLQATPVEINSPELQAAFCIDVRSEVMRRALEAQSADIQTLGFAGFFGLPLEYQPSGNTLARPQLPGLLKPIIRVSEIAESDKKHSGLNLKARWQTWSQAAPSAFSMVESMGWSYAFKMLKNSFLYPGEEHPVNQLSHQTQWRLEKDQQALSTEDKGQLAKGILHAMGLSSFAPTVLLVGHGSHTTNNLHAAGLDCGACGGQTGEVNVRVLAQLLNDSEVRSYLAQNDVVIPESTVFVAAIHNTTTDHIDCFDQVLSPQVQAWLSNAKTLAQRERAAAIDSTWLSLSDEQLDKAYLKRSNDWSQIRPEWGLASNAAFIVAPRSWTRNINLAGRSFLHEYQWQKDPDFAILELIMTAPMVVTNWINMQYNASTTDNFKYGSGNKVLHNAVGGHIGVFEGNGGDLRIGLSLQSLHDGKKWMHNPQRLAVYLAAPKEPIEQICGKHENVKQLIDNQWLYLLRWDDSGFIERYFQGQWLLQGQDK